MTRPGAMWTLYILHLIRLAGDYVSGEVCYRIVQVVINTQEVQGYTAKTCFKVRGTTFVTTFLLNIPPPPPPPPNYLSLGHWMVSDFCQKLSHLYTHVHYYYIVQIFEDNIFFTVDYL